MIENIISLDKQLFIFLNNLGSEKWDSFWVFISNKTWMFLIIAPIILFYLYRQDSNKFIYTIFFLLVCFGITDLIHLHCFKNIFMRLRPCWDPEISHLSRIVVEKGGMYSFVSGHAANSTAIVSFFLLQLNQKNKFLKYGLIIWLLLVCYSRIYLGKHFPLDVFFGAILGLIIAHFISNFFHYIKINK
ncbi:MAG: phosphatase PAP2 family protein [Flavobacteriales bacterium TMED191]|nr:MAG: phosphatase PAP2 family protein [Flavobacteriales bacterium TMED191]|tara:strand:+ start:1023 stop:1586 length:564 start_codon:yes stop_codon:yes gene_type:complete